MPDLPSRGDERRQRHQPNPRAWAPLGVPARRFGVVALALVIHLGLAAMTGCTQGAATAAYTPATGIALRSATIAAGHGCGLGPDEVYKYAAVVTYAEAGAGSPVLASNVFDCYADGVFSNLPVDDAGDQTYSVAVYAFNSCSFSGLSDPSLACPSSVTSGCPGEDAGAIQRAIPAADWTTLCTATQTQNLTVVAVCPPLEATGSGAACADGGAE